MYGALVQLTPNLYIELCHWRSRETNDNNDVQMCSRHVTDVQLRERFQTEDLTMLNGRSVNCCLMSAINIYSHSPLCMGPQCFGRIIRLTFDLFWFHLKLYMKCGLNGTELCDISRYLVISRDISCLLHNPLPVAITIIDSISELFKTWVYQWNSNCEANFSFVLIQQHPSVRYIYREPWWADCINQSEMKLSNQSFYKMFSLKRQIQRPTLW